jgi:Rrf2 family protein
MLGRAAVAVRCRAADAPEEGKVKVSAKAEYACIALVDLAGRHTDRQPVQIKTIAQAHRLSPRFLVQVLLQMKAAGLVASSRGAAGGYQLTRDPATITLAHIIDGVDRAPSAASALGSLPATPIIRSLREVWQEITREERRILEKTNLADLVQRSTSGDPLTYHI